MSGMQGSGGHRGGPSGLSSSADGFTLEAAWKPEDSGGRAGTLEFRILDSDDRAVRDFDEQHDRAMHLMVTRRDLTHYRHLHPSMGDDGTWSAPLTFPESGPYRAFADLVAAGARPHAGAPPPAAATAGPRPPPLPCPESAPYRVFADFAAAGRALTLGDDLEIPGR